MAQPFEFDKPRPAPWQRPRGLAAVLAAWRQNPRVCEQLVLDQITPSAPGVTEPFPDTLPKCVQQALLKRGVDRLYSHQARALALAAAGHDFVIATPTASGKSLCYNLPVLTRLAQDPEARALYMFPTKALSRDQEDALHRLLRDAELSHAAITYDGDTPADARRAARESSGLLITNPDMLHTGILPHHTQWARFFANLSYIVVDELHVYRGVFGSHFANVMRRLLRVARFHGSTPQVVFASATIGNAQEHASRILGRPVELVEQSGAPAGPRHVLVYNPPVVNKELGIRASYIKTAVRLALDLVRAEVPTLIFGQSRNNVEVMLKYMRDRLQDEHIDPESIHSYRGGYLPETRRRIEKGLREGTVRCVVATSALELGIDIGALDAVVCTGYPGSVAGLWQRFGRGGRRGGDSLALLVTSSAPLDQYFALQPDQLVGAPVEQARIDPDNVEVLVQHLKCAAFELPFRGGEGFGDLPAHAIADALDFLVDHKVVHPVASANGQTTYHWAADSYPANNVSLRQIGWDNFVIIEEGRDQGRAEGREEGRGKTIAEMDWRSAHTMLHEQAIYQHAGEQYQVERLDFENRKAFVRKVSPDYYTDAMTYTRVSVLEELQGAKMPLGSRAAFGEVSLVEKVVGFKKIKYHTHENVGYGEVQLPEMQMHTTAFWLTVAASVVDSLAVPRPEVIDALRGVGYAMHTVAAVGLMVDPRDVGRTVNDGSDGDAPVPRGRGGEADVVADFDPTLFLYDHVPGGVGLAERIFSERQELLQRTRRLIENCRCEGGCPGCVGPVAHAGTVSRKALASDLLAALGAASLH